MSTLDAAHTPTIGNAIPVYQNLMNPILRGLRSAGRPLTIEELDIRVIAELALPPELIAIPHDPAKSSQSEVSYRMAWARTYLKKAGLLSNPRSGTWDLTEKGRDCGEVDARALAADVARTFREQRGGGPDDDGEPALLEEPDPEPEVARALLDGLRDTHRQLLVGGELLSRENVEQQQRRFREEFGPDVLGRLDGEPLLMRMHGRGTKDSLVYWLEFKNDAEFGGQFGGIGGGTALKFGIYQAAESGAWMTGTGRDLQVLTTEEAIFRARAQRDQLVRGAEVLHKYLNDPSGADLMALQADMQSVAPDLAESSWGHKYFSLVAPSLIGPFHGLDYQNYQLIKLLRLPGRGRYDNASSFLQVSKALGLTLYELGATLLRRHGTPHGYWRVGTTEAGQSEWPRMRDGDFVGVGWSALGDLAATEHDRISKEQLRARMQEHYPAQAASVTRATNQLFAFVTRAKERDVVLAMEGTTVRGIGRILGDYFFQSGDGPFAHRRHVEWLSKEEWRLPIAEGLQRTFHPLGKYPRNLIELETRVLRSSGRRSETLPPRPPSGLPFAAPLTAQIARIHSILQRKRQAILYGPPGTGKTYWAERAAVELSARSWFGVGYDSLSADQRMQLERGAAVELCTFHPAYGYEDFLEGYRPASGVQTVSFVLRDGVFKRLCQRAREQPKRDYFLVIDEINRGDIPRIFGELLTVLEHDKRGKAVTLPISGEALTVPPNVLLIGTMNTADRSIALLDAALRRRFGFLELLPDTTALNNASLAGLPLGAWLDALNQRIVRHVGRDARNLQIGHSYLMVSGSPIKDVGRFTEVLRDEIIPLLEEYCYEDFGALEQILGRGLVRRTEQRINDALFAPDRQADLIEALRSAFPEIATTPHAVAAEIAPPDDLETDDEEQGDGPSDADGELPAAVR